MADQGDVAEQLLDLAREDLAAAKALNEAEGVSASKSGFNAQQAVEKALKAVLAALKSAEIGLGTRDPPS